jgi:hypothetical protein
VAIYRRSFITIVLLASAFSLAACGGRLLNGPVSPDYLRRSKIILAPGIDCADLSVEQCRYAQTLIRRATRSTVWVLVVKYTKKDGTSYRMGSGVVVDRKGTVLTAEHVIDGAICVTVLRRKLSRDGRLIETGRGVPMRVVNRNAKLDAALLVPDAKGEALPPPIPLSDRDPKFKETVWSFGHTSSWSEGWLVTLRANMQWNKTVIARGMIKVHNLTRKGDSGGPLLDNRGKLLGILILHRPNKKLSYYRPAKEALKALGWRPPLPAARP